MYKNHTLAKKIGSLLWSAAFVFQQFFPFGNVFAAGPNSPDFSDFVGVNTGELVDPFSGDFSYSIPVIDIPGPHGGGYSMALNYNSGVTQNSEASWVGLGWSLSPGAINREKRGFPDDVKNGNITYYDNSRANETVAVVNENSANFDALSAIGGSIGFYATQQYNSEKGLSYTYTPYKNYNIGARSVTLQYDYKGGKWRYEEQMKPLWYTTYASNYLSAKLGDIKVKTGKNFSISISNTINPIINNIGNIQSSNSLYRGYSLHGNSIPRPFTEFSGNTYLVSQGAKIGLNLGIGESENDAGASGAVGQFMDAMGSILSLNIGTELSGTATKTTNERVSERYFNGYFYSGDAQYIKLMDYVVERDDEFNIKDKYLPIPHGMHDQFSVSAPGLGGLFRGHMDKPGEFYPVKNPETDGSVVNVTGGGYSSNQILNVITLSLNYVTGEQSTIISPWNNNSDYLHNNNDENDAFSFRFQGDIGGKITYDNTFQQANLNGTDGDYTYTTSCLDDEINNGNDIGYSSFIGYHKNSEISNSNMHVNYSKREDINNFVDRSKNSNTIGEYSIVNKTGTRYNFSLPVYAKNEFNYSYLLSEGTYNQTYNSVAYFSDNIKNILEQNFNEDISADFLPKIGSKTTTPYASTYLITEILQPNYIDKTFDGPTEDDFGAWTKFNYDKLYGYDEDEWFNWRYPYTGMIYDKRQLSNSRDDVGTCLGGEKEVYVLESIETESHIADFQTSYREDALEAKSEDVDIEDEHPALSSMSNSESSKLKKLDAIRLYKKDKDGNRETLIKTVKFEYDYSLIPGVPNSNENGVLTLKKVWFEYYNVKSATNPVINFEYNYPQNSSSEAVTYPDKNSYDYTYESDDPESYADGELTTVNEYGLLNDYVNGLDENPEYDPDNSDPWGNNRLNGASMISAQKSWLDQSPSASFDPAVYNLKRIILPSGGEIHVQYEQDEYAYVQNKRAMGMVKLNRIEDQDEYTLSEMKAEPGHRYYLDFTNWFDYNDDDRLTLTPEISDYTEQIYDIKNWIEKAFIAGGYDRVKPEKIFFKFFFTMDHQNEVTPENEDCAGEFISGYAEVIEVVVEESNDGSLPELYLVLDGEESTASGAENGILDSPREACIDYYDSYKAGLNESNSSCENYTDYFSVDNITDAFLSIYSLMNIPYYSENADETYESTICLNLNEEHSYFRIPVPKGKKGGGIRVKRLLTYDPSIEGDNMVYGHEYLYLLPDSTSSGVASNEPFREENTLISFFEKRNLPDEDQLLAVGENLRQFQGPIGEMVLPGSQVGYSKILIKNIHSDYTHDGINIKEFYTAKDYPVSDGIFVSNLSKKEFAPEFNISSLIGFANIKYSLSASQAYSFVLNNMHGVSKRNSTYTGLYENLFEEEKLTMVSSIEYEYFEPGENIPVMYGMGNYGEEKLGVETDICAEGRKLNDISKSARNGISVTIVVIPTPPFVVVTAWPSHTESKDETTLLTHVTTKTSYFPSILKSSTAYADGTFKTITNKYFNPITGEPIVVEMSGNYDGLTFNGNEHNGKYYKYSIPAIWQYEGTGNKAGYEGITLSSSSDLSINLQESSETGHLGDYYLTFSGDNAESVYDRFTEGDLIKIALESGAYYRKQVDEIEEDMVYLVNHSQTSSSYPTSTISSITILESGRTNQLNLNTGEILAYGDFTDDNLSSYSMQIDDTELSYRENIADYLNNKINNEYESVPTSTYYQISLINPETGECTGCMPSTDAISIFDGHTDFSDITIRNDLDEDDIIDLNETILAKMGTTNSDSEGEPSWTFNNNHLLIGSWLQDIPNTDNNGMARYSSNLEYNKILSDIVVLTNLNNGESEEEVNSKLYYSWSSGAQTIIKDSYNESLKENFTSNYNNTYNYLSQQYNLSEINNVGFTVTTK